MPQDIRLQAYQLAQSLPHFDRDLTAYYLELPPTAREYELLVAHSIMRLHAPPTPQTLLLMLGSWRNQGLLHVLHVAALNMPTLQDWFPVDTPDTDKNVDAFSLLLCLETLNQRPREYAHALESFIATQDPDSPTAQAIASTLDRLAILMGVKSNACEEPDHDLPSSLAAFPHLDSLEPQDVWARIKPVLIRSCPPSLLRPDPSYAKKRVKQAKGTW